MSPYDKAGNYRNPTVDDWLELIKNGDYILKSDTTSHMICALADEILALRDKLFAAEEALKLSAEAFQEEVDENNELRKKLEGNNT